jgi:hypothetical protein
MPVALVAALVEPGELAVKLALWLVVRVLVEATVVMVEVVVVEVVVVEMVGVEMVGVEVVVVEMVGVEADDEVMEHPVKREYTSSNKTKATTSRVPLLY